MSAQRATLVGRRLGGDRDGANVDCGSGRRSLRPRVRLVSRHRLSPRHESVVALAGRRR